MLLKNSRYQKPITFQPAEDGTQFPGIRPRVIGPANGVVEHVVKRGERLDLLARHYYNDDRLWWRIVDANPEFVLGHRLLTEEMVGQVILIPKAKE